jgi:hypothetical protein
MKTLDILICTVIERTHLFSILFHELQKQINYLFTEFPDPPVKIIYLQDNKEISVGRKRQQLLQMSQADFIVFFDDDDAPCSDYVRLVFDAINSPIKPDCIGINVLMTTNGSNVQRCCHSLKYPEWKSNVDDWDYVRNITHFNPVKKELALEVGFSDTRFGEDKEYSDKITKLCQKEFYIEKPLFNYRFNNSQPHNEKYGIK